VIAIRRRRSAQGASALSCADPITPARPPHAAIRQSPPLS
jgi:hypothetical protein